MSSDRFWPKVDMSGGVDACWPWTAGTNIWGYGCFWLDGGNIGAHVFAYRDAKGPIPDGYSVLHSCDNPPCCNPDHLFCGTQAQNMADKVKKGRQAKGEDNGNSKLTRSQVAEIRSRHRRFCATNGTKPLSVEFGVSPKVITDITKNRIWRD